MSDNAIHTTLKKYFSESSKRDWEKIATDETGKNSPLENLSWFGKDDILYLPYYDAEDVADLQYLRRFNLPAAVDHPSGPRTWANLPAVLVTDETKANLSAINHLSFGAEGVLFDLRNIRQPDVTRLLHQVSWPHCMLAFQVNDEGGFSDALARFAITHFDPQFLQGALFWESVPKNNKLASFVGRWKNFKSLGCSIRQAAPTAEISDALIKGVETYEGFSAELSPAEIFRAICFSLPAGPSLLESAAKFKALRMLWYQVAHAYGHKDFKLRDVTIHARSLRVPDDAYAPHENMLKGTFSAVAAIAGGCDMLTVECDDAPAVVPRQARNISMILREESFFNQSADPFAGSYTVDAMTHAMAEKAWSIFQNKLQRL